MSFNFLNDIKTNLVECLEGESGTINPIENFSFLKTGTKVLGGCTIQCQTISESGL